MKTFEQFQLDSQQLDEGLGTVAKVAIKSAVKFAKKGGLKKIGKKLFKKAPKRSIDPYFACLLYTSPSPRDRQKSRMPSSA